MSYVMTIRNQIKGRLVMQGKSLSVWARENGYTNGVRAARVRPRSTI